MNPTRRIPISKRYSRPVHAQNRTGDRDLFEEDESVDRIFWTWCDDGMVEHECLAQLFGALDCGLKCFAYALTEEDGAVAGVAVGDDVCAIFVADVEEDVFEEFDDLRDSCAGGGGHEVLRVVSRGVSVTSSLTTYFCEYRLSKREKARSDEGMSNS